MSDMPEGYYQCGEGLQDMRDMMTIDGMGWEGIWIWTWTWLNMGRAYGCILDRSFDIWDLLAYDSV